MQGNVKLSEVLSNPVTGASYYRVEADVESFTPPEGVAEIGFLYKSDDGRDVDETLLDVIISYGLSNVPVLLEVPAESKVSDPSYLMSIASNVGFSVSLLPPENKDDESAQDDYIQRVSEFTLAYLGQKNFSKSVYPISSYMEYMFLETLTDVSGFKASNEYMINSFVSKTTEEFSDEFKAVIRKHIHAHFGGVDGFRSFAKAVYWRIYKMTEENCKDTLQKLQAVQQPNPDMPSPEGTV